MKKGWISLLIALLLVIAVLCALLVIQNRRNREDEVVSTALISQEVNDVLRLSVLQLRASLVFPYDFVPEEVSWENVASQYAKNGEPEVWQSKPLYYTDGEIPQEIEALKLYHLGETLGLNMKEDFLVIQVKVKIGYDWTEKEADFFDVHGNEEEGRSITFFLPEPEITSFEIADSMETGANYPDVKLSPGDYASLIETLSPKIREILVTEDVLATATERTREFLSTVFSGGIFSRLIFAD